MYKKWLISILTAVALTACSSGDEEITNPEGTISSEELDYMVNGDHDEESPDIESDATNEETVEDTAEQQIPEAVPEPSGTMEDWKYLDRPEKVDVINRSIEYEKYEQESKGSKVEIVGTVEDFIMVLDERYQEIENYDDNMERFRMMNASIASQVSIMGHQRNLIEFVYNR